MAGSWNGRTPPELCGVSSSPTPSLGGRGIPSLPTLTLPSSLSTHLLTVKWLMCPPPHTHPAGVSSRVRNLAELLGRFRDPWGREIGAFPYPAASPTQASTEGPVVWPRTGLVSKQLMNSVCRRPGLCPTNPSLNPSPWRCCCPLLGTDPKDWGFLAAAPSTVVYLMGGVGGAGGRILEGPRSPPHHALPSTLPGLEELWPGPGCGEVVRTW